MPDGYERNIPRLAKKKQPVTGLPDKDALYLRWLESEDDLDTFAAKEGIDVAKVRNLASNERWGPRRQELLDKATAKIEKSYVAEIVEDWTEQRALWKRVEEKASELLNDPDMTPKNLVSIASAIEKALDARKLLCGDVKPGMDGNSPSVNHSLIVQVLQILKDKIPTAPIDTTANG